MSTTTAHAGASTAPGAPSAPRRRAPFFAPVRAIAGRELSSYFRTPGGWIIIALYVLLAAVVFVGAVLVPAQPASMRAFFEVAGWLLLPVAPAISMRLLSEELRTGTIEPLLTSPASALALVLGKFAGSVLFVLAMAAPTLVFPWLLWHFSDPRPDLGPLLAGYACLLLVAMAYLAIGLLASACTSNATLAFLVTLFAILALLLAGVGASFVPEPWQGLLRQLALPPRVADFARGIIDSSHVVYLLSLTVGSLIAATAVLSARRW